MHTENAERVVALTRMFDAYGQIATPSRIDAYLEVVGSVPVAALIEGVRDAMRESTDYPPGPGTVRRCALAVARMRPGDPVEMPRDTGPRLGPGSSAAIGLVTGGMERRVARCYADVIDRAREIVKERGLPATLDARLWSLGEAERELGFVDSIVDRDLERSLAIVRAESAKRLGVA